LDLEGLNFSISSNKGAAIIEAEFPDFAYKTLLFWKAEFWDFIYLNKAIIIG